MVVVVGASGIGKTELVAEHFHRRVNKCSFAWWISAHEPQLVIKDLAAAASAIDSPGAEDPDERVAAGAMVAWLRENTGWLLVLDDVRDPSVVAPVRGIDNGTLILTSTNLGWPGADPVLELDVWSRDDSIAYLAARADSESHAQLAEQLGDLPLALTQARSYIAATGTTVERYLELFARRRGKLLRRGDPGGHGTTLATAVELALTDLSHDAGELARILSVYAPDELPTEIIRADPELADLLPGALSDDIGLEDAIAELRRMALIRREGPSITMHQLVQHIVFETIPSEERPLAIARAAALVGNALPVWADRPENWDQYARLLPHVLALSEHREADAMPGPLSWLLNRMGTYIQARGDAARGIEMLERAVRLAEQDNDRVGLGSALTNLANAVAAGGDLERGIELAERSIAEKRAGNASPMLVARSLGALGSLLRGNEEFSRALRLHREALALLELDPDAGPYEIADECNDIAECCTELGLYDQALAMRSRALHEFEGLQGPDGDQVGRTHTALGMLYEHLGDHDKALSHRQRAVEIFRGLLQSDFPDPFPLLSQVGLTLMDLGHDAEARDVLERAVATARSRMGDDHVEVGLKLGNLGIVLAKIGDLTTAVSVNERSLRILRNALGDDHPSVIRQRNYLAFTLTLNGDVVRAEQMFEDAITSLLRLPYGPLHAEVFASYLDLILDSSEAGSAGGALVDRFISFADDASPQERTYIYAWLAGICTALNDQQRLQTCVQRLTSEPAHDQTAISNLGLLVKELGHVNEAEQLWTHAAHLGCSGAMTNLGLLRYERGNADEAEQWHRKAAELGLATGMCNLAVVLNERGAAAEAEQWHRKAAELGHAGAMANLGRLFYERGDLDQAETWYRKAAEHGLTEAMHNLGVLLHEQGNLDQAEGWWRQAVELGHAHAMFSLGLVLHERGDLHEAEGWWRQAAGLGHESAMVNLGALLSERGDADEAEQWWRQAVELRSVDAMVNIAGLLYERGDVAEAEQWYRRATKLANPHAMAFLGVLLNERGDTAAAEEWYRKAAAVGHAGAMNNLGLLLDASGDPGDADEAEQWWRQAVELGSVDAMVNIAGLLYERGDVAEAEQWYRRAADQGSSTAMDAVAHLRQARGDLDEAQG